MWANIIRWIHIKTELVSLVKCSENDPEIQDRQVKSFIFISWYSKVSQISARLHVILILYNSTKKNLILNELQCCVFAQQNRVEPHTEWIWCWVNDSTPHLYRDTSSWGLAACLTRRSSSFWGHTRLLRDQKWPIALKFNFFFLLQENQCFFVQQYFEF